MGKPGERQARLVGDARGVNRCQKWLGPAAIDTTLASLGKQEIRSWSASPSSARPGRQGPNRAAPRQQATSCSAAGHAAPPAPPTRTRVHRGEAARVAVRARVGQHCGDEGDGAAGGGGGGQSRQGAGRPSPVVRRQQQQPSARSPRLLGCCPRCTLNGVVCSFAVCC